MYKAKLVAFLVLLGLTGCGGMAKGVTEALLDKSEAEDTRLCHIEGPPSEGLVAVLGTQVAERAGGTTNRQLKILMVHGIGRHIPGYSGRLTEHLMQALALDLRDEDTKDFTLSNPKVGEDTLGHLRASRFTDKAGTRELVFYELTWSEITEAEKKAIAFDNSTEYTFRRTQLNGFMKQFFNSHIPDPLIYLGEAHIPILASVQQAFCWMTVGDWEDYPDQSEAVCDVLDPDRKRQFEEDDFAFITHSLGSRILIDAIQELGDWALQQTDPELVATRRVFQEKQFRVYMFANQLPLLELGRKPAPVRGQIKDYCRPGGSKYGDRMIERMPIYAFSDPNDMLSYPIPPNFADEYMDSRICPQFTNITLNVTSPINLFGLSEVANPLSAHVDYDHDERVIALMAQGLGQADQAAIISERCTWLETRSE
jgi:hypothetical protein